MSNKTLEGLRVYLSGPIEYDTHGIDWRGPVKEVLRNEFSLKVFDPFADPKQSQTDLVGDYRKKKDYDALRRIAKWFVRKDLAVVDRSDIIIAHVPRGVPTVGTVHEVVNGDDAKKPTLLVCPQGKEEAALWYFGIIHPRYIFGDWESLYGYLREVNAGVHHDDDRWQFIYYMQDYLC